MQQNTMATKSILRLKQYSSCDHAWLSPGLKAVITGPPQDGDLRNRQYALKARTLPRKFFQTVYRFSNGLVYLVCVDMNRLAMIIPAPRRTNMNACSTTGAII